jgi:hypothetical protein
MKREFAARRNSDKYLLQCGKVFCGADFMQTVDVPAP